MASLEGLALQKQMHEDAFRIINNALDHDDEANPEAAIPLYMQGLAILERALQIRYPPHQKDEAEILNRKFRTNLENIVSRVEHLQELSKARKPASESPGLLSRLMSSTVLWGSPADPIPIDEDDEDPPLIRPLRSQSNPKPKPKTSSAPKQTAVSKQAPSKRSDEQKSPPRVRKPSLSSSDPNSKPKASPRNADPLLSPPKTRSKKTTSAPSAPTTTPTRKPPVPTQSKVPAKASASASAHPTPNLDSIKGIDKNIQETIINEIVDHSPGISWSDIAGLEDCKQVLQEMVIYPSLRPDIFTGLRSPPKGLLLFGPPGNGKTMIAKAVATESKATFFSISASSLTSKWVGESEKLVRALFAIARYMQPSLIFIDEIDSLLSERSSKEQDSSRRLKTEFLIQFDGVGTNSDDRIIVMGATNRPEEIDEAARRRLVKRIYVPLPSEETRSGMIEHLLSNQEHNLTSRQVATLAKRTEGYSGSDLSALCREAAMVAVRGLGSQLMNIEQSEISPISMSDFEKSMNQIRASVSAESIKGYQEWNKQYGSLSL
eukprot:TRINITY_DN10035_c0_g1_i2.p1 TRINITY_DN10035_c0_g1~~TRINITY_DN10035_c0_g1_i2.p1  ORF type:complete len:555 (-),score=141.32 TRINITY_DN10035_c0_g1_i2:219-1862(-)